MWLENILTLILLCISYCEAGKVLAFIPYPSYSHQVAFSELWKQLSLRGHNVTVMTSDPLNDPALTNLTEIDMKWMYELINRKKSNIHNIAEAVPNTWNTWDIFMPVFNGIAEAGLSHGPIQDLIHKRGYDHFDVIIVQTFFSSYLAFSEVYKCPYIMVTSTESSALFHRGMGNPFHPALTPETITNLHGELTFWERIFSFIYAVFEMYKSYTHYLPDHDKIIKKYFNTSKSALELISNADMLFSNVNPAIQGVRALGPTTINIASQRSPLHHKAMPKDMQKFLDGAKDGFVYFSLGSNVKSSQLQEKNLQAIKDALRELPYKVLWKFEIDELADKPDNVMLVKWSPQHYVLAHPNIKVFVTQGGLQSMEEAIYNEVPSVVIPFFGDQFYNARLMVNQGFAKSVNRFPFIDKEELKSSILEVIQNPKYKNTISKIKHYALDQPMSGLEQAIWWVEYVMRNKGAKHLRNPAADLPYYQYFLLDVIGFLLSAFIVCVFSIKFAIKKLLSKILANKKEIKATKKKQ